MDGVDEEMKRRGVKEWWMIAKDRDSLKNILRETAVRNEN